MADVPDQAIARGVENVVQGGRQFDHAEAGAKMPACNRDRVDGLLAQLVGYLSDLFQLEPAQILRSMDGIEKRCLAKCGHSDVPVFARRDQRPGGSWVAHKTQLTQRKPVRCRPTGQLAPRSVI